jgi:hypothetical protein
VALTTVWVGPVTPRASGKRGSVKAQAIACEQPALYGGSRTVCPLLGWLWDGPLVLVWQGRVALETREAPIRVGCRHRRLGYLAPMCIAAMNLAFCLSGRPGQLQPQMHSAPYNWRGPMQVSLTETSCLRSFRFCSVLSLPPEGDRRRGAGPRSAQRGTTWSGCRANPDEGGVRNLTPPARAPRLRPAARHRNSHVSIAGTWSAKRVALMGRPAESQVPSLATSPGASAGVRPPGHPRPASPANAAYSG